MKEDLQKIKIAIDEIINSKDVSQQTKQFVIQELTRRSFDIQTIVSRVESNQEEYIKGR